MEKLTNTQLAHISGGQIENCNQWMAVVDYLVYHGHMKQAAAVLEADFYGCLAL